MRIHREQSISYTYWVLGFCAVVLLCFLFVGARYVLHLAQTRIFDGEHAFTVAVPTSGDAGHYLILDPQADVVRDISVKQNTYPILSDLTLTHAIDINTPIDAWQLASSLKEASNGKLNMLDEWYLMSFFRQAPQVQKASVDDTSTVTVHQSPFLDATFISENQSIQIMNASNVQGAGNRLAQLLTVMGANVVAVQTAVQTVPNTRISTSENTSYTVRKMSRLLGVPVQVSQTNAIADIVITLGLDWGGGGTQ